jgi:hypothetical protein
MKAIVFDIADDPDNFDQRRIVSPELQAFAENLFSRPRTARR